MTSGKHAGYVPTFKLKPSFTYAWPEDRHLPTACEWPFMKWFEQSVLQALHVSHHIKRARKTVFSPGVTTLIILTRNNKMTMHCNFYAQ